MSMQPIITVRCLKVVSMQKGKPFPSRPTVVDKQIEAESLTSHSRPHTFQFYYIVPFADGDCVLATYFNGISLERFPISQGVSTRYQGQLYSDEDYVLWESRSFNVVGVGIDIFAIAMECPSGKMLVEVVVDDVTITATGAANPLCLVDSVGPL